MNKHNDKMKQERNSNNTFLKLGESFKEWTWPWSSPAIMIGSARLKQMWVNLARFTTFCSHSASCLFWNKSNTWTCRAKKINGIVKQMKKNWICQMGNTVVLAFVRKCWKNQLFNNPNFALFKTHPCKEFCVYLSIACDGCEYSGWIWRPGNTANSISYSRMNTFFIRI